MQLKKKKRSRNIIIIKGIYVGADIIKRIKDVKAQYKWNFFFIDLFMTLVEIMSIFILCFCFYKFLVIYVFI